MTTIAFDGRYLAADGHIARNNATIGMDAIKLVIGAKHLYALAGSLNQFQAWMDWAEHGTETPRGADTVLVRVDLETRLSGCCMAAEPYFSEGSGVAAWGSGDYFALAVMDIGYAAMEAVCLAARRDPLTKGIVRYIDLQDLAKGVQTWPDIAEAQIEGVARRYLPVGRSDREKFKQWFTEDMLRKPVVHELQADLRVTSDAVRPAPMVIRKPSKHTTASDPVGAWLQPECTGRLIDATGCGHCLRCNREWFALLKRFQVVDDRGLTQITLMPDQVEATRIEWDDRAEKAAAPDESTSGDLGAAGMFDKLLKQLKIEQIDRDPSTPTPYYREGDGISHYYVELVAKADNMISCRFALADKLKAYLKTVPTADRLVWRVRPEIESFKDFQQDPTKTIWRGYCRLVALPAAVNDGVSLQTAAHPGWPDGIGVDTPRNRLVGWVNAWNAASEAGDHARKAELDIALRTMTFPENCRLISHVATVSNEHPHAWKQIVWEDGTKTPEG